MTHLRPTRRLHPLTIAALLIAMLAGITAVQAQPARDRDSDRPGPGRAFGPPRADDDDRRQRRERPDAQRVFDEDDFARAAMMLENFAGPEAADRLRAAAAADPEAASATIRDEYPRLARFLEFRRRDPMAELRMDEVRLAGDAKRLAREHRQAVADDRPELAKRHAQELRETIALQLDLRAELREYELEKLQERLAELRAELDEQSAQRDAMIDRRFAQLTSTDRPTDSRQPRDSSAVGNASEAPATQPAE
ncbi:MAG: hypothetical protein AAGK09_11795 [Planctomycetota bacterium]